MAFLFAVVLLALITRGLAVSNEKLIHMFWTPAHNAPGTLNRKVETAFRSALRTQTDARIIVWTHAPNVEKLKSQTLILQGLRCRSGATIEVRSTEELSELSRTSSDPLMHQCAKDLSGHGQSLQQQKVAYSDLLRFAALYFFGGLYVDADTFFLRDMRDFHGQSFAFKWDRTEIYYNTAIMGLPRGSPLVPMIIGKAKACNAAVFYPITIKSYLNCTEGSCDGFVMMPTSLFNPAAGPHSNWMWQKDDYQNLGMTTNWFFDRASLWKLEHFFPGSYAFHWHNRWTHPVHNESFFAQLEQLNSECTSESSPASLTAARSPTLIAALHPQDSYNHSVTLPISFSSSSPTNNTCRKIYVDFGGYTGDTLDLYGKVFLRGGSGKTGLNGTWEAYIFELDYGHLRTILKKLDGPLAYLKPHTHVLNVAVWNQDTVLKFAATGHNDGRVSDSGQIQVLAYDIGSWFMRTIRPTDCDDILVKMDIEGAEVEAIQSLSAAGAWQFVDHLAAELHTWIFPRVAKEKPALDKLLEKGGLFYNYATLDDQLDVHYKIGQPWPVSHCDSHYFRTKPK